MKSNINFASGWVLFSVIAVLLFAHCGNNNDDDDNGDPRDEYVGTYTVTDSLFHGVDFQKVTTYNLTISINANADDRITLGNLWGDGTGYYATISSGAFNIPSQQVSGPYYTIGSGTISGGNIVYETSGDIYVHRGQGTKQ